MSDRVLSAPNNSAEFTRAMRTLAHRLLAILALAAGWLTPAAGAQTRVECKAVESQILRRAVRYCVILPRSYDEQVQRRYPVLYHLHGLSEDEQTLINTGLWDLVEQMQREGRIGEFLVVAPDGGSSFYINSRDGRTRYEDFFIREFLPAIEQRYRIRRERSARGITGISMGGYGALRFALKYPDLFSSVSAHSAALMQRPPQILSAAGGSSALGGVFGSPIDSAFWERNSPFTLARNTKGLSGLKIYFDCGREDHYGFATGAQQFHELLTRLGIPHEFHLYPGGHDWAYFAEHVDESLEFHSRAFRL
jgi:S-formylglutathione hydrolase FrmB